MQTVNGNFNLNRILNALPLAFGGIQRQFSILQCALSRTLNAYRSRIISDSGDQ